MAFKPERDPGSVKSLLALLRSNQDEPSTSSAPASSRPNAIGASTRRPSASSSSQHTITPTSVPRPAPSPIARPQRPGPDPSDYQAEVPSQRNLQELIETLRKQNEEYRRPQLPSKNSGDVPLSPSPTRSFQGSSPPVKQASSARKTSISQTSAKEAQNAIAGPSRSPGRPSDSSTLGKTLAVSAPSPAAGGSPVSGSQRIELRGQSSSSPNKKRKIDTDEPPPRRYASAVAAPLKSALKKPPMMQASKSSNATSGTPSPRAKPVDPQPGPKIPRRRSIPRRLKPLDVGISNEFRSMPFSKALPIVSRLIGEDSFLAELRKMKAEQDALERSLWAERQGVTRALMAKVQRDKEVSSSRFGNSISASTDRKAELKASLEAHHVDRCLPAWDDLRRDHQIKLEAMGVPGLGDEDQEMDAEGREAMLERRDKVMALLEGVMAEG